MLWLIPLFPLVGAILCGILHFRSLAAEREGASPERVRALAGWVAVSAIAASFAIVVTNWWTLVGQAGERVLESSAWAWIDAGSFHVDLSMVFDPLSSVMCLVITGVGLLIHIYSTGYMHGDAGYAKFFAYLNLFVSVMLVLVLSSSLIGLFVGWEGVGLCSYLLIGFWYDKTENAAAGQKAFVMNRIGDASFLLGSFLLISLFSTLDLSEIGEAVPELMASHPGSLALAALLLFGGACGKSAQFPLFTWLPDAMAGPTPVSALIHAATMVTSGIYLTIRLNPLFAAAPSVLLVIGFVGALTALIGASSALFQRDIKKVLAYSTVSQLGYMFLGLAAGAWSSALFHLVTHAFFKGLLFLGAGSVIHGMADEQDMVKMGGLKKHMPRTFVSFLAGAAALSGIPLMSGFFSKDEILTKAFANGALYWPLWIVGVFAAALTAFYTWRMVSLTFFGEERFREDGVHPHESPASMTVPLLILAAASVFGGVLNLPEVLPFSDLLGHWLEPVTELGDTILATGGGGAEHLAHATEWILLGLGSLIALVFAHRGFHAYRRGIVADEAARAKQPELVAFLEAAWRIDSTYMDKVVGSVKLLAFFIASVIDQLAIDGTINAAGAGARSLGARLRRLVDGSVENYALHMAAGAVLLALTWIWF
ncbi:MAG TPA: NADH-quinone oxidoreductase subunit L [Planctomycetes bacterium]|nr:NADH-quinone oxidoreductase subunit L [Planctomycetota bacterium]